MVGRVALLLLPISLTQGMLLRQPAKTALGAAGKVDHLLRDVQASMKKESEDSEIVFATLYTFDQHLAAGLDAEVGIMNKTLKQLRDLRWRSRSEVNASHSQLSKLATSVSNSDQAATRYEEGTRNAGHKFDTLLDSLNMLTALLQSAAVTPDGLLVTQEVPDARGEPARVYHAIRGLLSSNRALCTRFGDVFDAFVPAASLAQKGAQAPRVHMTPTLLGRTVAALKSIQGRLRTQKSQALLQLTSQQGRLRVRATTDQVRVAEQQGIQVEKEEQAEEFSFSTTFTEAVLRMDKEFHAKVLDSIKIKAQLVDSDRKLRQSQQETVQELIDILGKASLATGASVAASAIPSALASTDGAEASRPAGPPQMLAAETGVPNFFQMKKAVASGSDGADAHLKLSNLQVTVEDAIRKKADTHAILMNVKALLERSAAPINVNGVRSVVNELAGVLRAIDDDQQKADYAKQRCEAQSIHAKEEEQAVRSNLELMQTVEKQTNAAIEASKGNLKGISSKIRALEKSSKYFARIVDGGITTMERHSSNRRTIIAAVQKAGEIMGEATADSNGAAVQLLGQLLKQLEAQDKAEQVYRAKEAAFRTSFLEYVKDYKQLLGERRGHYESSLSVLELYSNEVANDSAAQQDVLGVSGQLGKESSDICDSVLKFYKTHSQRNTQLSTHIRKILPKMPEILSDGN